MPSFFRRWALYFTLGPAGPRGRFTTLRVSGLFSMALVVKIETEGSQGSGNDYHVNIGAHFSSLPGGQAA